MTQIKSLNLSIGIRVSTTLWLHNKDFYEKLIEKAKWELHKDAASCFEWTFDAAAPNKKTVVWPLLSHLINQSRRARHAGHSWWSKNEFINSFLRWTPTHGHISASQTAKTFILQLGGHSVPSKWLTKSFRNG